MRYDDFVETILGTVPSDWRRLCGPVPQHYMGQVSSGDQNWLEVAEHHSLWILAENIRISLAYGMHWADRDRSLSFPELPTWPDDTIYACQLARSRRAEIGQFACPDRLGDPVLLGSQRASP